MISKLINYFFPKQQRSHLFFRSKSGLLDIDDIEIINTISSFKNDNVLNAFLFLSRCIFVFNEENFFSKLKREDFQNINNEEFVIFLESILNYEYEDMKKKTVH